MINFSDMGLVPTLLENLKQAGYSTPTAIQEKAIPVVMEGHDLLGIAQTGTGKTAAFALPILHRLASKPSKDEAIILRALILVPTRELCTQIHKSLETYGKDLNLKSCTIFGGVPQAEQVRAIKNGIDIL
ncbi:MAG: DEAD/DEAH box helicase, partial [Bdellovibrionales bacterium]|nr:DEAD/DEAH box helicase [Bdellovibrionales bacterium]